MMRFAKSKVVLIGVALTASYVLLSYLVPARLLMIPLTGAFIGASLLVMVIYAPLFWQAARRVGSRVGLLAIGMGLLWASLVGRSLVSAFYRVKGQETAMLDQPLTGFFVVMGVVGALLHVAAPGYPAEGFRTKFGGRYRWFIVGAVVAGAVVAVCLSGLGY